MFSWHKVPLTAKVENHPSGWFSSYTSVFRRSTHENPHRCMSIQLDANSRGFCIRLRLPGSCGAAARPSADSASKSAGLATVVRDYGTGNRTDFSVCAKSAGLAAAVQTSLRLVGTGVLDGPFPPRQNGSSRRRPLPNGENFVQTRRAPPVSRRNLANPHTKTTVGCPTVVFAFDWIQMVPVTRSVAVPGVTVQAPVSVSCV